MQFTHKVSKGSAFNQIYVPRGMEVYFEVGDLVEVKLLEKKIVLYYSKIEKLGEFKEKLIKEIFSFLSRFEEVKQTYVVGSFLTSKADYQDIDLILITNKLSDKIYESLTEKFGMKFHVISMTEEKRGILKKICPLTRSMFYYCVSNKVILESGEREIDANHLRFLLMLPEDSLEINLSGRAYYDCLRRLIAIEKFLSRKEEDPKKINSETEKLVGENLFLTLKDNEQIEGAALKKIRKIMKEKLDKIGKEIANQKDDAPPCLGRRDLKRRSSFGCSRFDPILKEKVES
ncbi:MAG: hypothetical protein Q8L29_02995 [archaeon]|nr:hypothetical protein [archaeon]